MTEDVNKNNQDHESERAEEENPNNNRIYNLVFRN
jgi:hypothetical protein